MLFKLMPYAFSWTQTYEKWKDRSFHRIDHTADESLLFHVETNPLSNVDFVPKRNQTLDGAEKPVKLICFYLPQFHPIPENDKWWGKGFTAWTNVRPAQPQFSGHYQPRVPGELGYYNLLDKNIQRRQVDLAKKYGIGGFCFYFYWFGGKRLLEQPTLNWLENKDLDLPFCLCWANENWTRRWDGMDKHVLIAQHHSPQDDIAFISHISKYMRDERYIRVDGKPLLIVYRPSLLPFSQETVQRWRTWCRENGVGEIYLAYTQSFEKADPASYGFDAAIEFPPNNASPPNITASVTPLKNNFACNIFDWRVFLERSKRYTDPDYKLFRSVCPSWDNTARRRNQSTVFVNNSPSGYKAWLENAVNHTLESEPDVDKRMVFVNAWNEWDEGAYLEPDQRYGYAYLDATYEVLAATKEGQEARKLDNTLDFTPPRNKRIAVILHLFYPEMWPEICSYLRNIGQSFSLYVSTSREHHDEMQRLVLSNFPDAKLFTLDNRGRDIAPFLELLRACNISSYDYVCKIHTKKSPHRIDGSQWRNDLLHKLMGTTEIVNKNLQLLEQYPDVGVLGPEGHLVNYRIYWGSNKERVEAISKKLGLNCAELDFEFVGGSMFWFKPPALQLLSSKDLLADSFEEEAGQVDGTLAHAVERLIPLFAYQAGYKTVSTDFRGTYQNPRVIDDRNPTSVKVQQKYKFVQ